MVFDTYNYGIHGVYKPINITGGHHVVEFTIVRWVNLTQLLTAGHDLAYDLWCTQAVEFDTDLVT